MKWYEALKYCLDDPNIDNVRAYGGQPSRFVYDVNGLPHHIVMVNKYGNELVELSSSARAPFSPRLEPYSTVIRENTCHN